MNKYPVVKTRLTKEEVEFQRDFSVLKERIHSLNKETKEPLSKILESIKDAMDTLEELALVKARLARDVDDLMDAIDEGIEQLGFFRGEYVKKEAEKVTRPQVDLAVEHTLERIDRLAKNTGLDPLYLAEKIHQAFDDIQDEVVSIEKLEELGRNGFEICSWEELKAEFEAKAHS